MADYIAQLDELIQRIRVSLEENRNKAECIQQDIRLLQATKAMYRRFVREQEAELINLDALRGEYSALKNGL